MKPLKVTSLQVCAGKGREYLHWGTSIPLLLEVLALCAPILLRMSRHRLRDPRHILVVGEEDSDPSQMWESLAYPYEVGLDDVVPDRQYQWVVLGRVVEVPQ